MKTKQEIADEIAALTACKKYVPSHSMFGESNHDKIDAQIRALTEGWDTDETEDTLQGEDAAQDCVNAAVEAVNWREGDANEIPSEGWAIFKPKA